VPELWVGDFDSAGSELTLQYRDVARQTFPAEKDATDGAIAVAEAMLESPDYPDPEEARAEKVNAAWADVPTADIDDELSEHLIALPGGRYRWRICVPAMMSYWSELARDIVLPRSRIPTTLIRGAQSDPPYVGTALIDGLAEQMGPDFTMLDFDCRHMVPLAKPSETAAAIRDMLARV
jgi:lipase